MSSPTRKTFILVVQHVHIVIWPVFIVAMLLVIDSVKKLVFVTFYGVLASKGCWEAWQHSPQGYQESSGQVQGWKSLVSFGEQVHGMWYSPSVLWHCWLGDRNGIQPVKSSVLVCWWWWFDWSFARVTAPVVTTISNILSSNNIQNGDILVLAYPDYPGKWPLNECHCRRRHDIC